MESPIITKSTLLFSASSSFSWCSFGMNFFSEDGTGMTVEGFSENDTQGIAVDSNNEARRMVFFEFMTLEALANEADFSLLAVLPVLGVDAAQLQVSGLFR